MSIFSHSIEDRFSSRTSLRQGLRLILFSGIIGAQAFAQTFVKVTDPANQITLDEQAGTGGYVGASWIDYNNDGKLDLFSNRRFLYRNEGNGIFTKTATNIGANLAQAGGNGNSWADYDNDGDLDCYYAGPNSRLYRNEGNEVFTPILTGAIGDSLATRGWSCAWADYDNDSFVDLLVVHPANFVPGGPPISNQLFHNDGPPDFTFTRVTTWEFVTKLAPYTVATWSDYDDDGDVDLFIGSGPANGTLAPDYLYRNTLKETGTAGFERITGAPLGTDRVDGQVWNWIDYDNDGDLDAYLTNYGGSSFSPGLQNNLYRNDNGAFVRMTGAQVGNIVTDKELSLANIWGDFDNDADLDAVITQEMGFPTRYYQNNGDGTFTRINLGALTAGTNQHSCATAGDYDEDGDLDIYITGFGTTKGLFRNDLGNGNHSVNILCVGQASNRAALGARVRVKATINGKAVWQQREISAQNSFNGHNMLNAHVGLGDAAVIDSLKITWPSGMVDVHTQVAADSFYIAVEGESIKNGVQENPGVLVPQQFTLYQNYPNPFNPMTKIRFSLARPQFVTLKVFEVNGREVLTLINEHKPAGSHEITYDASRLYGSGVFLYQLRAGNERQTRKMILAK